MARFGGYGLTIESAFELPGAIPLRGPAGAPDITIAEGRVPQPAQGLRRGLFQLYDSQIIVDCPDGRFLCKTGGAITVEARPIEGETPVEFAHRVSKDDARRL